jgi:hypothetical protein
VTLLSAGIATSISTHVFSFVFLIIKSGLLVGRDRSIGIAARYGLDGPGIESRGGRYSAPVQTGPGAHPASYTMGTGSFPGGKAAGAWR